MKTISKTIKIISQAQMEFMDVTKRIQEEVAKTKIKEGMVNIYIPHTTASVRINHNEPFLLQDIMSMLYRLVPIGATYNHDIYEVKANVLLHERSNGHAHVAAFLLGSSETVPIVKGKLELGERQSIFFIELDGGRERQIDLKIMGE